MDSALLPYIDIWCPDDQQIPSLLLPLAVDASPCPIVQTHCSTSHCWKNTLVSAVAPSECPVFAAVVSAVSGPPDAHQLLVVSSAALPSHAHHHSQLPLLGSDDQLIPWVADADSPLCSGLPPPMIVQMRELTYHWGQKKFVADEAASGK